MKDVYCDYIDGHVRILGGVCWVRGSCYKFTCPYKLGIPTEGDDE